ncbi:DUF6895 family protein [Streptomyces synnematoformans]|uniref:DUF6895 domain-containing protein n=1 Tax=Streptomyces synnematoformans TaxID=415721 RepID=A0ABN2YUC9_9ACTN
MTVHEPAEPVRATMLRTGTRALGWLNRNRGQLTFAGDTTAELAEPDSVYKPLGELALAASLVLRDDPFHAADRRAARDLLDFAWDQLRGGDLLYERQLRFPAMTDPLETYVHFHRAGHRHEPLQALLAHLTGLASYREYEHVPNRRMAVANATRVIGIDDRADWPARTAATWLGATPEPWTMDWMTAYHVTHTVFHLTDWGAEPRGLPPHVRDYLATWLPVWTDVWLEIEEWDLVAELLLVDACLPEPAHDPAAWRRLAAAQHEDGLLPRDGRTGTEDPAVRFYNHYHTAVAAVTAATAALSRSGA